MSHSISFFRDEIRNGFYIPTAIKQSWAAQLDVIAEIDRICSKYDITYFADWGTFLGAVRHGGIIPWDDDVDICMKRDDYNKFRKVCDLELPKEYVIHDYERHENHWLFLSRVVNNSRISFDEKYLLAHQNFPWISGVDIFVKDYLYKDPTKEKERCDEIMYLLAVAELVINNNFDPIVLEKSLSTLSQKYSYTFPDIKSGRELAVSLYRLAELQMSRVPEEDSDRICQIYPWGLKGNAGEPKEYYKSAVRLPFEDTTIPVPAYYNNVLQNRYGNYLAIRKGTGVHDYPSFESQRKLFEQMTGAVVPHFTFDQNMLERPSVDKRNSYKTLVKECLDGLYLLYQKAVSALASDDPACLEQALGDAQQLAADMGTTIEYARGENDTHTRAVVSVLEKLCETIYNCYSKSQDNCPVPDSTESASQDSPAQGTAESASQDTVALSSIRSDLEMLGKALETRILSRREVLFLPIGAREWKTMQPIYRELTGDPDVDVFVVPLPLMFKDYYGNVIMSKEEIRAQEDQQSYPEDIVTTHFSEYDPSFHCPDRIFIQSPYDGENPCLTVPRAFYAKELLPYTDDLVYIPIGATSEFSDEDRIEQINLKFYVTMPGVIYADHVYVQSANIRKQYINALSSFAGESTRDIWAGKISFRPELFFKGSALAELPFKNLLFCISSYEMIEHGDRIKSVIRDKILALTEAGDRIHVSICTYPAEDPGGYVQEIINEKSIDFIRPDLTACDALVSEFDAYYGSASPLVPAFVAQKKPVMIADFEIS